VSSDLGGVLVAVAREARLANANLLNFIVVDGVLCVSLSDESTSPGSYECGVVRYGMLQVSGRWLGLVLLCRDSRLRSFMNGPVNARGLMVLADDVAMLSLVVVVVE
jgi:hypothetical protein